MLTTSFSNISLILSNSMKVVSINENIDVCNGYDKRRRHSSAQYLFIDAQNVQDEDGYSCYSARQFGISSCSVLVFDESRLVT